jgi:two-component system sensor histidine kinase TctE
VREIVQQHGGDIEVLDNVYQASPRLAGARFRITLHRASLGEEANA